MTVERLLSPKDIRIGIMKGLNCRSDGGPKEEELKTIYMNCLRRSDGRNSNDSRGYSSDQDWKDSRRNNQNRWDKRDDRMASREDRMTGRDDRYDHDRDDEGNYGMMNRNDRMSGRYDSMGKRDRMESVNRNNGRNYQMNGRNDRRSGSDDRMNSRNDGDQDDRHGRDDWMNRDDRYGRDDMINGREDFSHSHEYGSESSNNPYRSSQNSHRYRRERQQSKNSGSRSQYNPNSSRGHDGNEDRNSSENNSSKDNDAKGCVLHCFLEELEMTGDNGMPDRYLVTHAITKDVKNEDLKDFLQESIEECFQILYNENTEDKCDFSKNLMMCLSEKGRANCDDWKDGFKTIRYS
ncbi:hypothetical protein MSG28_010408 [Choristoneura fumiferana]|uniref:Uncharacterized protein n=1 Tax=Choristoneura fumiferana TaxID=7141 RepID=A0ACC0KKP9_CHOFU|nr:hypothetical protein MSG28_010408 [Choristoneura fumiferana]